MKDFFNRYKWTVVIGVCVVLTGGAMDPMTQDALRVENLLKTIETQPSGLEGKSSTTEVTEKEINAYIAYSIAREQSPYIHSVKVALLENNQVRGHIKCNGTVVFLDEDLSLDFKGILHTREGLARLDLTELRLDGQPMDPQLLDSIVKSIGSSNGGPPAGIEDWYEMPKGIKRVITKNGKAILYY